MTFTTPPAKFGGTNKRGARRTDFKGATGDEAPAIVTTDLRRMPAVVRRFFRNKLAVVGLFVIAAAATVHDISARSSHAQAATPQPCLLLHGKRLFTLAGYEVNASFTPGGKFHRVEISRQ